MFQTSSPSASASASASASTSARPLPPPTGARLERCPPVLRRQRPEHHTSVGGANWRAHLSHWIDSAWPSLLTGSRQADASKGVLGATPLARVRADFSASLIDINTASALKVQRRIALAPSLHELWHVRSEVFDLVSHQLDQSEAERRLSRLNRHFPSRAARPARAAFGRPTWVA